VSAVRPPAPVAQPAFDRFDRGGVAWMAVVALVYGLATFVRSQAGHWGPDHMMILANDMLALHRFDLSSLTTINDIVTLDGRHYQAMSLLPTVPYFVFVPFEFLWPFSRWIVSAVVGILAAWTALPLARRYGPGGPADYWLATLGAFGTLLFTLSIEGDFYYLAHLESVLLVSLALIEWRGARRPALIGLLIGLAGLARPTLWIAAVPFGLALLWERRDRVPAAAAFGLPLVASVTVAGWFDCVRFGSPLETGYTLSWIEPPLAALRAQGLFSVVHLPANLGLFLFGGIDHIRGAFPWIVPSTEGHSILLTTPAILVALSARIRNRTNLVLWSSAFLTAIPVFLYYGGGGATTYGFRYEMDFMPFLLALVAAGSRRHFGEPEKALIALSVVFVCYGFVWQVFT
jgi:hypothetical protein